MHEHNHVARSNLSVFKCYINLSRYLFSNTDYSKAV